MLNDRPRQWNPLRAVGGIVGEIQGRGAEAQVVGIEVDRDQAGLAGGKRSAAKAEERIVVLICGAVSDIDVADLKRRRAHILHQQVLPDPATLSHVSEVDAGG